LVNEILRILRWEREKSLVIAKLPYLNKEIPLTFYFMFFLTEIIRGIWTNSGAICKFIKNVFVNSFLRPEILTTQKFQILAFGEVIISIIL